MIFLILYYTCQLFFSKMHEIFNLIHLHRTWISKDVPTASGDFGRLPKIAEDFQQPTMRQLSKIAEDDDFRR